MSKNSKLFVDDTGAVGEGAYEELTATISDDQVVAWKTIVAAVARGDSWETEEAQVKQASIPATIKFVKGSTIMETLHASFISGEPHGVKASTGDVAVAGHMTLVFDALIKTWSIKKQTGSSVIVETLFVPHTDGVSTPTMAITTAV